MPRKYDSGNSLSQKILEGVNILADNVGSTLGPRGRNVILHNLNSNPIITKDGVTVAKFVELDDPMQNLGAKIVKQASEQTNAEAGDGTTTATILARAILTHAQRYVIAGAAPTEIKRGIDKAVAEVITRLEELSRPIASIEDIEQIATISANGDRAIGKLIALAIDKAGKDGAITIEEARAVETSLDIMEGFRFDSGYLASAFITDERRGVAKYDNPLILVTDGQIETVEEILPVLELVSRENRPLVIVAENVEGQALAALIMNALRGTMRVAAIKAPRYGEERRNILQDLAIATGATFVAQSSGTNLKQVKLKHLGTCKSIETTKYETTIVSGGGDSEKVEERIEAIKAQLSQAKQMHECEVLQERITKLASGIAIIHVGGSTEIEMIEKKHRIEDALEAVKSAQLEGIVPGGGVALLRAVNDLKISVDNGDQQLGVDILKAAALEPMRQMAINAGESPDLIISRVLKEEDSWGYDFTTRELEDMMEMGIIDPVKVTRCALQNAASVAATLITANYAIVVAE
jgi:chaperonin GroEL